VGYTLSGLLGFWPALVIAPLVVGGMGALFERLALRRVHKFGHVAELLITFGLSYVVLELVQLVWGRTALEFKPPESLQGPAFTLVHHAVNGLSLVWGAAPAQLCSAADAAVRVVCSPFPLTRGFMMLVALLMLLGLWLLLTHTRIGLVIQAALTHPHMAEALGHNVPRVFMLVFGVGTGLAGLAGVIGGSTYVTEPSMAATVGSIIFVVVVVGGLGSLMGAFLASLLIGMVQTFAVVFNSTLSQLAPVLPYLLLVLILIFRPTGLLGKREA
jgi:branched-chain amino acid transport system permease protein